MRSQVVKVLLRHSLVVWYLLAPVRTEAVPISYRFTLAVAVVEIQSPGEFVETFPCATHPHAFCATPFVGRFDIDDAVLSREGNHLRGVMANFHIRLADVVFDQNQPSAIPANFFRGFIGPVTEEDEQLGLVDSPAPSPGLNVHGGMLTGLTGGVLGDGDAVFIDFIPRALGTSTFQAHFYEFLYPAYPPYIFYSARGDLILSPVPEPSTLLLVGSAVALLLTRRQRTH